MNPENKHSPLFSMERPWNDNPNSIWLGSTLVLMRNVEKFHFPHKLSLEGRIQVMALLSKALLACPELRQAKLWRAEETSPSEKEFLVEHFLSTQSFQQMHTGDAFVLNETGEFLAVINLKDHLLLEWVDIKEELEGSWERLAQVENALCSSLVFAFSQKWGFLTADPNECGLGLKGTVFLHLPALLLKYEKISDLIQEEWMELSGFQGDPEAFFGDIVAFRNRYTLGLSEETVLAQLRTVATKLSLEEKSARAQLKNGPEKETAEIKNMISRSYAILLHSYQLEAVEAMEALSLIKLGLDLEWIQGTSHTLLNRLLFTCRRAHLLSLLPHFVREEDMVHQRATYIHQNLKGVELLI